MMYESWVDQLHDKIKREMDELRSFINASELAFDAALTTFAEQEAEIEKGLTADEAEWRHEYATLDAFRFGKYFPRFGRHMAFAASFNAFEGTFVEFANTAGRLKGVGFKVKDRGGVDEGKDYLSQQIGLTEIFGRDKWAKIQIYSKLRNLITHQNAIVENYFHVGQPETKAKSTFKMWVQSTGAIDIDDFGEFTLTKEYCLGAIGMFESFLEELVPLLPKPRPRP